METITSPLITTEEYGDRLDAVRGRMTGHSWAGLFVCDPSNLYYLTGYNAWSFYMPQVLFVPASGEMLLFARDMDAGGAHRTSILRDGAILGYPETLVHRPDAHPFEWVCAALRERDLLPDGPELYGVEMDSHYLSAKAFLALQRGLGPGRLEDCQELVNWVRVVKSEAEITFMERAARVTQVAMEAAIQTVGVGVPQNVVAAEISRAQALGADDDAWGDFPAIVPMLPTSESADTPHLTWSNRRFIDGDAVVVELAGVHRRYHVPLARTAVLGRPSAELRRLEHPVAEGLSAVLDTMKPGVVVAEVSEVWNRTLNRHGLSKDSRLGYSIGIGYPPDWGERTVSIRSEDQTILQTNMTLHVICGMWMTGYGYEVSESVQITASGAKAFTHFPRELIHLT